MKNYYLLYVTGHCPWCVKAINLLNESGLEYAVILLDQALEYRRHLKKRYSWDTVPIVIEVDINGEETLIGGYTDLEARFVELGLIDSDENYVVNDCDEQGCTIVSEDTDSVSG
jgi:glutaredoxin